MQYRFLSVVFLFPLIASSESIQTASFAGTGTETATSVAVDATGSIYMTGTTTSFDLPVLNGSVNRGAELLVSHDSGRTWRPLSNLSATTTVPPYSQQPIPVLAVSPVDPNTVYAARGTVVYKSTDGLQTLTPATLPLTAGSRVTSLAVSPSNPSLVYATSNAPGGVFKSTDAGITWAPIGAGILPYQPAGGSDSLVIDPFHPNSLWVWAESRGFVSNDGGISWSSVAPLNGSFPTVPTGYSFAFDAATPGVIYAPDVWNQSVGIQKSVDGGVTWQHLSTPFNVPSISADPLRPGYLYSVALYGSGPNFNPTFYRSIDAGATWQSFPLPGRSAGPVAINAASPNTIIAGSYRSEDDGQTWTVNAISRAATAVFAAPGSPIVYAAAPTTSDAFLVKYASDGQTPLLATYFGGMGTDTAASIRVDPADNIWVFGTTNSTDLPITPDAVQKTLTGLTNLFVAKFDWSGALLYCSYVGSTGTDRATAMALGPDGSVWLTGTTDNGAYPITPGSHPNPTGQASYGFVTHLDNSGTQMLFSTYLGGAGSERPSGIAVDGFGSATVVGQTFASSFPVTSGAFQNAIPVNFPRVFVVKFHIAGDQVFSTYAGGKTPVKSLNGGTSQQDGNGIDLDAAGNIYLTGSTSMTDFPVTPDAYQPTLRAGCTYPAFSLYTGMIGNINEYSNDNLFLMKLSPDGKTLLYSTLLGGSCYDRATGIAVTPDGVAFITGETDSQDFPQANSSGTPPAPPQYKSTVSAIDTNHSTLTYSSYLFAGPNPAVALSPSGALCIAGAQGAYAQTQQQQNPYEPTPAPHAVLFTLEIQ